MKYFFVFLILAGTAYAQSIDSHNFKFSDTLETVGMEDALGTSSELIKSGNPFLFRASFDYARDSLSATNLVSNPISIVDHLYAVSVGGSALIHPRILIGITGSLHYVDLSSAYVSGQFDENGWKFGDMDVHAKIRLTGDASRVNVALRPSIELPTGSSRYLLSDDSFRFGGRILADTSLNRWKIYFHAGMSYAGDARFLNLDQRKLLDVGLGIFYAIHSKFGLNAEWLQSISVWNLENGQNPAQVNLGIRYDAGLSKIFLGSGVQGFDFADDYRPLMLYAGVKRSFGAKSTPQAIAAPALSDQSTSVDSEFEKFVSDTQAMVVYFKNNSSGIQPQHQEGLNQLASEMSQQSSKIQYIVLHGHADQRGSESYNKRLSQRRAQAVKAYLVDKGVHEHAILTDGYGEMSPKTSDESSFQSNRRVEFVVIRK